jgi:hypothetical protein
MTMRIWNLSEPSAIDEVVVEELRNKRLLRPRARPQTVFQSVKVIAGVTAVFLSLSFGEVSISGGSVRLPNWSVATTRSVPEVKPPLDGLFSNRFDSEWTQSKEDSLVRHIVESRLMKPVGSGADDIAAFVLSNQQESIVLERPLLDLHEIRQIVKNRKA